MKSAIENMKKLKKEATIVAEALENTMHQLPVHGAKVSYFQKFTRKFRNNYFLHNVIFFIGWCQKSGMYFDGKCQNIKSE